MDRADIARAGHLRRGDRAIFLAESLKNGPPVLTAPTRLNKLSLMSCWLGDEGADVRVAGNGDLLTLDPFECVAIVTPARFLTTRPK